MIVLTVLRPGIPKPRLVTARYDAQREFWLCEDAEFYHVLKQIHLPEDYYPDESLALVNYVAKLYCGTVTDLRNLKPHVLAADEVF